MKVEGKPGHVHMGIWFFMQSELYKHESKMKEHKIGKSWNMVNRNCFFFFLQRES